MSTLPMTLVGLLATTSVSFYSTGSPEAEVSRGLLILDRRGDLVLMRMTDGRLTDCTEEAGLGGLHGIEQAHWADLDGDGLEEVLFVAPGRGCWFYQDTGAGLFAPLAPGTVPVLGEDVLQATWRDFDRDGRTDLHVTTVDGERVFRNVGEGMLEPVPLAPRRLTANPERGPGGSTRTEALVRSGEGLSSTRGSDVPEAESVSSGSSGSGAGVARASQGPSWTLTPGAIGPAGGLSKELAPAAALLDQASPGDFLAASSVPVMGLLYPISIHWFLDAATGYVGVGNTDPEVRLDVSGPIHVSGKIEFPDGSSQGTAKPIGSQGVTSPWVVDGTGIYFEGGDVQIGPATSPEAMLHIAEGQVLLEPGSQSSANSIVTLGGATSAPGGTIGQVQWVNYKSTSDTLKAQVSSELGTVPDSGTLTFSTKTAAGIEPALAFDEVGRVTSFGDLDVTVSTASDLSREVRIGGAQSDDTVSYARVEFSNEDASGAGTPYVGAAIESHRTTPDGGDLVLSTNASAGEKGHLWVASSGEVGIRVSDPVQMLEVDGDIRSSSGGGFGFPDGSVQLTNPLGSSWTSLGPGDFTTSTQRRPKQSWAGIHGFQGTSSDFVAGVHLPHGARITSFSATSYDCHGQTDLRISLRHKAPNSSNAPALAVLQPTTLCAVDENSVSLDHTVANDQFCYFVRLEPLGLWNNEQLGGPGSNLDLYKVHIEWEMD